MISLLLNKYVIGGLAIAGIIGLVWYSGVAHEQQKTAVEVSEAKSDRAQTNLSVNRYSVQQVCVAIGGVWKDDKCE